MLKIRSFLSELKAIIIEIIFPVKCLNCGKEGQFLCEDCFSIIQIIDQKYCHICKKRKPANVFQCEECRRKTSLDHVFFATTYQESQEDVLNRKLILCFKYKALIRGLSLIFSKLIIAHFRAIDLINENNDFFENFVIIPIPLHNKRKKWRGFNQAEEIAKCLSLELKIPMLKKSLRRVKNTKSQTETENHQERKDNVEGAFECFDDKPIKERNVLLIDDIYTSGATIEEAAKTLKKKGVKRVWGCVVAMGS
ncbi:MAG: hypothetical protein KYQ20_02475 [Candidatus Nealsonbacteria bacterium]|nr:hypothetical protein [Candidatus Nealsonbacteria bacterium]